MHLRCWRDANEVKEKDEFQGAAQRRQDAACLDVIFTCLLFVPSPICTCNYLFTPGSAQVLLIPFLEGSAYVFPRINSPSRARNSDTKATINLCSWLFQKESRNREGWEDEKQPKKQKKKKKKKKEVGKSLSVTFKETEFTNLGTFNFDCV